MDVICQQLLTKLMVVIFSVYSMIGVYEIHHESIDNITEHFSIVNYRKYKHLESQLLELQKANDAQKELFQSAIQQMENVTKELFQANNNDAKPNKIKFKWDWGLQTALALFLLGVILRLQQEWFYIRLVLVRIRDLIFRAFHGQPLIVNYNQ
eukprot:754712_1